ncbi:DUF6795 domain-containing protein [Pseudoalteromonas sp. SSDWG2]|uniref:DUF6795 domain-containing protein n=1 Tax=Pseudoalteromonas sp. SSDWG2 TaxID=3139391 RepID=UPI003BA8E3EC
MRSSLITLACAATLSAPIALLSNNSDIPFNLFTTQQDEQTLSPKVTGSLFVGERQLANIEITRTLSIGETKFISHARTNYRGEFSFNEYVSSEALIGQSNARLWQDISVRYQGQQYVLWYTAIDHEIDNYVIQKAVANLECDLRSPEREININDRYRPRIPISVYSICEISDDKKKPLS